MLGEWEKQHPGRVESIFRSIGNVSLSQLADTCQFPFAELRRDGDAGEQNTIVATQARLEVVELI